MDKKSFSISRKSTFRDRSVEMDQKSFSISRKSNFRDRSIASIPTKVNIAKIDQEQMRDRLDDLEGRINVYKLWLTVVSASLFIMLALVAILFLFQFHVIDLDENEAMNQSDSDIVTEKNLFQEEEYSEEYSETYYG